MPVRGQITLFHVRGIRVSVDYSWFFVLFLVIVWMSGSYEDALGPGTSSSAAYALAVASALAFFGSILLHELGHALVSVRNGIEISDVSLWMFGGVTRMARDSDSPGTEFKIAVAGPLVTLAIAAACIAIGAALAGGHDFRRAAELNADPGTSGLLALVAWVATMNLFVLALNLIPAYPLDGGRIARAIAWRITGDRNRATRAAAGLGRFFSYLFIAAGILLLLTVDPIGGIWLALIGWILGQSARGALLQTEVASRISGIHVRDIMDDEPVAIPKDATVEQALDEFFLRYRWPWFPVVDAAQRFLGLIDRSSADAVPEASRGARRVEEVFAPDASGSLRVRADAPLEDILGNESLRRLGALVAVDPDGRIRGVVTADQVSRALRSALERA